MTLERSRREVEDVLFGASAARLQTDDDWAPVEDRVLRWFAWVKVAESDDTFQDALLESRMTMRAILEGRQAGFYEEKVPIRGQEALGGVRDIRTMQGLPGLRERMNSANFSLVGKLTREKYSKGLFDMSAVLLNPRASFRIGGDPLAGGNQIYRTSGDTTYVFMPVPREEDMHVFHALNLLAKTTRSREFKDVATYIKGRLTRIKLVFEGDAGAKFLDFAPASELLPKFRYGFGNLLKATASNEEIARRKAEAVRYKQVLRSNKRNEIIVAYRQHGELARQPSMFPVLAKGVFALGPGGDRSKPVHKGYVLVNDALVTLPWIIDLRGQLVRGTEQDLGGSRDLFPPDPKK